MDYSERNLLEKISKELSTAITSLGNKTVIQPMLDLNPIGDGIREGLTAIATAIEYKAQLEDTRVRDLNIRIDKVPRDPGGLS